MTKYSYTLSVANPYDIRTISVDGSLKRYFFMRQRIDDIKGITKEEDMKLSIFYQ